MPEQLELKLENLPGVYKFDGGENEQKWMSHGMPKGVVPDQYVERCSGGAVNLHIVMLGSYEGCRKCEEQEICRQVAINAGDQMDSL